MLKENIRKNLLSSQAPSGGFLASLQKDRYPFIFPRDNYFVSKALLKLGENESVEKYVDFLFKVQKPSGEWVQRYSPNGTPSVTREKETDVNGLVLTTFWEFIDKNNQNLSKYWPAVKGGVAYLLKMQRKNGLFYGKHAIHENQELEQGNEIWTNCWAVRGLESASKIAGLLDKEKAREWTVMSEKIKKTVLDEFWDDKKETFIKTIKDNQKITDPDIAMVSPAWIGLLTTRDSRVRKTVSFIKDLWDEDIGGYHRFNFWQSVKNWHWYDGGNGSWSVYTLVMLHIHRQLGHKRVKECREWMSQLLEHGLLPEHVATEESFKKWQKNETEMSNWIKNGIKQAKKSRFELGGKTVLPWARPFNWPNAELIINWEDEFL